ncbi:facilitated trehalose transporter Tret1-like [Planococcus citri]|uniref:facilitated trehalose transporter Tret1-like n=1 Tax=Planococcus citri TaxID=170843 RepID=UPI0031F8E71F
MGYSRKNDDAEEAYPLLGAKNATHKEPEWKQYLAAFLASIISFSSGCVGGWSSPATPKLLSGNASDLGGIRRLTIEEVSWVGSLINLGAFFGSIPAGYLSFRWGRKKCLLSLAVPIIVGWLMILYNFNNVWFLYIGRFVSGISYGSLNVALPIYNNEICNDNIRGRVGIFYDLMQCVGLVWVYSFGAFSNLFWVTVMCLVVPVVFIFTFILMPESPLYLIRIGREEEAIKSIKWLHGDDCNVDLELARINQALSEGKSTDLDDSLKENTDPNTDIDCENGTFCCPFWEIISNFYKGLSNVTIKAVLIAFFMFVLQRTCGATMVQYYTDSIFQLAQSSVSPNVATILIGIVSLVSSLVSIMTVDFLGRRFLLTFSFFVMTLSMAVFVGYLTMIQNDTSTSHSNYGLIPSITLCIFVAMFRLGVSPIPWFMAPEIIPTEAQKWAPSTIVCITWGTSFLLSKSFLPAINASGQLPVYSFFLIVCAIGVLYTWIFIPETKNKSRQEIQKELGAVTSCYEAI